MLVSHFPVKPTVGQTYSSNGLNWVWSGTTWNVVDPANVSSFNGLTGPVTGVSSFNGVTGPVTGVSSFNGVTGPVTGVSSIVAGTNITLSPTGGTGSVTINASVLTSVASVHGLTGTISSLPAAILTTTSGDVSPGTYAKIYSGDATPATPVAGDIWIDSTYGSGTSNILRWRKIASGGETTISGLDANNISLIYTPGYEELYINGVLQYRGSDYVATNGTTITGLTALVINDTIEVVAPSAAQFGDYYTQAQITALLAATTPIGTVNSYAGATAPTGWLLCDNLPFSAAAYPALAALLGDTYGTHSGDNYYKPDLRGRTIAGKDDMGGTAATRLTSAGSSITGTTLGASGGAEKMSHVHYASSQGADSINGDLRAAIGAVSSNIGAIGYQTSGTLSPGPSTATYTITGTIGAANQPFNHYTPVYGTVSGASNAVNVQPTVILNYIIKAI